MREETVIIPHPNEMKKLTDLQKQICATLSHDEKIVSPRFPLYVRGNFEDDTVYKAGKSGQTNDLQVERQQLPELTKLICGCTLTKIRTEGKTIALDAEITLNTEPIAKKIAGRLEIARWLRGKTDDTQKTLCGMAETILPIKLPVFRIASVFFTQDNARTAWLVHESKWIKGN